MIFSDVTFHDQNGYSEEKSPVTYHLKTNFLLRNIFPINLHLFIKFCLFCMNVATDLKFDTKRYVLITKAWSHSSNELQNVYSIF